AYLFLLDGFELRYEDNVVPVPTSVQRLVSLLALHPRPLRRVYVAGVLWPNATEDRAAANLRSTLWRLRRVPFRLVEPTASNLRLTRDVDVDAVNIGERATGLIEGSVRADPGDVSRISRVGVLLPDSYDDWVLIERERFHQLRLHALE